MGFSDSGSHASVITKVFFTTVSLDRKTTGQYRAVIDPFPGKLEGKGIKCARVNRMAAMYSTGWACDSQSSPSARHRGIAGMRWFAARGSP